MGVRTYRTLDKDGNELGIYKPNSCFACFICEPSLNQKVQPSLAEKKKTTHLEVELSNKSTKKGINAKLIQTLVPGLSFVKDLEFTTVIKVPVVGIPFDQVICALRLLKFSHWSVLAKPFRRFNSDSEPSFIGFTWEHLKNFLTKDEVGKAMQVRGGYTYSQEGRQEFREYVEKDLGTPLDYLSASAMLTAAQGKINTGVLPPYSAGVGYIKFYSLLDQLQDSEPKITLQKTQQAKLTRGYTGYYDGKVLSANYPICVPDFELAKELMVKFPDLVDLWAYVNKVCNK
jgi:hypothetical protein